MLLDNIPEEIEVIKNTNVKEYKPADNWFH